MLEADSNYVQCNLVGTDLSGGYLIPNQGNGVYLYRAGGNIVGGDLQQGEGNLISGKGGLAIDLLGDGVTPNDGDNNPFKPNRGYNFPLFDQAESPLQGGTVQVSGSAPPDAFVELYRVGPDPDPSGHGQAMDYLTMVSAGADDSFTASLEGLGIGDLISAIAISPEGDASGEGNTSEFSANALMVEGEKSLGDTRW